ncbi:MAG: amphi-Trp domain-containing protein [Halohasta sp.]
MAQRTTADETRSREEIEAYLETLAAAFGGGDEEIRVPVGNKTVTLSPPEEVGLSVDVIERSSRLRGSHETIELELSWKP